MALFRKKVDKSVLPEVDQYYQAEKLDRAWLAWVLAIVSIAFVVLLLVGLFFAGKWAFNAITNDDTSEVATTNEETTELPSFDGGQDANGSVEGDSSEQDQEPETVSGENADEPTTSDEGAVNDTPVQTETPSQPSSTPQTGPGDEEVASVNTDDLPSTGPASLATTFIVASGLAGTAHYAVSRKRNR